jgi:hypothetical protein
MAGLFDFGSPSAADLAVPPADAPVNPFMPGKLQTLGMMLSGLGSGISAASARNMPAYFGIAPGAQSFTNAYQGMLGRAMNYDLARKNYDLNASYKNMQERMLGLQAKQIERTLGFQDAAMKWLQGGGGPTPGFRSPQGPTMGPDFASAIAGNESAGQPNGGYGAVGPDTGHGRAYGKYQVMDSNIGPWTQEVLGKAMTPQEFLANPQAQDAVFKAKFGQALNQYGNPQDAASWWFSGKPLAGNNSGPDVNGTTVSGYVNRFNRNLYGGASPTPGQQPDTSASPVPMPVGAPTGTPAGQPAATGQLASMPQPPGPPPDTTRLDALAGMNIPGVSGIAKAQGDAARRAYKFQVDQYMRSLDAQKLQQAIHNGDVIQDASGNWVPNPAKGQAAGATAAAQEAAKEQAKTGYFFPQVPDAQWQKMTPQERLQMVPESIRGTIEDLGPGGNLALSDLGQRISSGGMSLSKAEVASLAKKVWGSQFDEQISEARKTFMGNIYKQSAPEGATRQALITSLQHVDTFAALVKAQANGDTPAINAIVKAWNDQTGNPRFSGAEALMQFLAPEAAKVVKGGNQINKDEVDRNLEILENTKSWPQASTILQTWLGAMLARKNGLEDTARSLGIPDSKIEKFWGTGPKGANGKTQPSAMMAALKNFYAITGGDQVHGPAPQQTQGAAAPGTILGTTRDGRQVYVGADGKQYVR